MMLSISFYGSSLVSAYWNGAATYYRGLIKALARRGHRVRFFEPDAYDRQAHRDIPDPDWADVTVYPATSVGLAAALEAGRPADVVIKASGVGVFDAELEAAVTEARRPGQIVLFWDVDAPATLDRLRQAPGDPFHRLIPRFDAILTHGGGDPVVEAYLSLGARSCHPIYNALDPETHHPVPPDPRFDSDLVLLANRLPDREARVEAFFLRVAEAMPGKRFLLGGAGWGDRRLPANVRWLGHVFTADHNALNASALAVLNVSRDSMAATGFSPATRVFEAAGAGACLITDAWTGIDRFLNPDHEILVAESGADVIAILSALTKERAGAIGRAARRKVLEAHTYDHRALTVESVLNRLRDERKVA